MKIENGRKVSLMYRLIDSEGELVETTDPDEPLVYTHGSDEIFEALQEALEGAEVGSEHCVVVEPEDAFGEVDPDQILTVPRDEFPPEAELEAGLVITVQVQADEGEDEEEGEMEMLVVEVSDDGVVLDGNHPLAGEQVTFELKVVAIE